MQKTPDSKLVDPFGRKISYLRLSVTDRCDLRCVYCMAEEMVFLPKKELLTIEELYRVASRMIDLGVTKIRLTGGEPLVRRNIMVLFEMLGKHLGHGLEELTLTTNGTLLARYAEALVRNGVKRVNVSLDTLDPVRYHQLTRRGDIAHVLAGIDAAQKAGLKVKLNAVAMRGGFLGEVDDLIRFAHGRGMDLTVIEEMPMGYTGHDRYETFLSLGALRKSLEQRWTLVPDAHCSGGPARYVTVKETGGRLGFITPLSCDFCASCNRVRIGSTGKLYPCMGQSGMVELREAIRSSESDEKLTELILKAIDSKPKGHEFSIEKDGICGLSRHMSELGG